MRVGEFIIGNPIDEHVNMGIVRYIPDDPDEEPDGTVWDSYEALDESLSIHTEEGLIVSISCHNKCVYKRRNLIGLQFSELVQILDCKPNSKVDTYPMYDGDKDVYEFEGVSAQVWVRDGKVVTIIMGGPHDD